MYQRDRFFFYTFIHMAVLIEEDKVWASHKPSYSKFINKQLNSNFSNNLNIKIFSFFYHSSPRFYETKKWFCSFLYNRVEFVWLGRISFRISQLEAWGNHINRSSFSIKIFEPKFSIQSSRFTPTLEENNPSYLFSLLDLPWDFLL